MKKFVAQWDRVDLQNSENAGRKDHSESLSGDLPAPAEVFVQSGLGQVTLRWSDVPGASGYLIFRADAKEGPYEVVDHKGGDSVKTVPGPVYVDTTGELGKIYWYAVASVRVPDHEAGPMSMPVQAGARISGDSEIRLDVKADQIDSPIRPVWHMIGSEHLSQIFSKEVMGGREIGSEFLASLAIAHSELGATHVRAHGIFLDELELFRSVSGQVPQYNFQKVDFIYDQILAIGLKPIVELSFMPKELALDQEPTVFHYQACISKPRSWAQWADLVKEFVRHLLDRYGVDEVGQWGFEVWNEPNLSAFWVDASEDYFTMYKETVRAIKEVDAHLLVGGPATAAAGWVLEFIKFVSAENLPLDFLATHLYGNLPVDFRSLLHSEGFPNTKIWWTEWGVTPTHFAPINDSVFGAPFILHGIKRSQASLDALAYWVISDYFEELGRGKKLFHGGFGLLTVGNLRKPRFWALKFVEELGLEALQIELNGDGAGSLVDAWATRKESGEVDVLIWNGTLNQDQQNGHPLLDRTIELRITNLPQATYQVSLARIDALHSNLLRAWSGEQEWPDDKQWEILQSMDKLSEVIIFDEFVSDLCVFEHKVDLPMPGVARLRLTPKIAR